jgi:hypothetical protein
MQIRARTGYLDGGTVVAVTDEGSFYLDQRINTKTRGQIFDSYPGSKGAKLVNEETAKKIVALIKDSNDELLKSGLRTTR